jgi:PAS domain S-box-containing protein
MNEIAGPKMPIAQAPDAERRSEAPAVRAPRPPRSLARATLHRVALGVALIVSLSSGVTYYLLYGEIEQRALERLREYAEQRTEYHEAQFALGTAFHEVVKADFLERYNRPMPDARRRFEELMTRDPDGAYRNSPQYADVERFSTGWIHMRVRPDDEFMRRWMLFFDLSEHHSRLVTTRFTNFYFMHPIEPANMGYDDPERSNNVQWAALTPADYPLDEREYFSAASAANNPERQTVWAGPYLEPAYNKILVSVLTPVYVGEEHIATIGSDDILDDLEASILRSDVPGTSHTVFREDGRLIVDPQYMMPIVESYNGFHIREADDRRLDTLHALASQVIDRPVYGYSAAIDQYYAISRLETTGWYFASTLPGHAIRTQAFQAAQWVLWAGLASVALLLLSLAIILRRQVGQPLNELLAGIRSAAVGEVRAVPVTGDDEFAHLASAFNAMVGQVSERDAALRVEKERFRALIEHAADVILVVDAGTIVRYASPSLESALGVAPDAVLGQPLLHRLHADDRAGLAEALQAVLGRPGRVVERTEFRMRHADGSWRWMEATGTNQIGNPAVGGIVVNARDIAEAKAAEAEIARQRENLHQREKLAAMGSLLAGVAHELNNPLSIVVGRATMLEEQAADTSARSAAEKIRIAAERCARIVKTFLSMARQHKPRRGEVDVDRILEDCLEIMGYGLRTSGVDVERRLAGDLPRISADADQLHQVFLNLLVNAQQALESRPAPRRICIRSERDGAGLRVEIADNGPGVAEAIRSRIFDPYFTTKPAGSGTGVGLAVSLGIVETHGGTLTVGCPPGGGAVFSVWLPAHDVEEGADDAEAVAADAAVSSKRRFLIVDDEPELASLLADILRREAASIDLAGSGREALVCLGNREYDAVLTDLRMPEMDGPALFREIEQRWPKLAERVIFVTGDALSPAVQRFLADTGRPLLEKPFTAADVREIVAREI